MPVTISKENKSVIIENSEACELNGPTEREDTATDSEPEDDEDEREMEPTDWKVSVGPQDNPTTKERQEHAAAHTHRSKTGAHTA